LKESDGYGDGSQQASASDEDFEGSSDSDDQRKKKKARPVIPGERKSMRSRRGPGSMVRLRRLGVQWLNVSSGDCCLSCCFYLMLLLLAEVMQVLFSPSSLHFRSVFLLT